MKKFNASVYIRHDVTGIEAKSEIDAINKLRNYISSDEDFLILNVNEQEKELDTFSLEMNVYPNRDTDNSKSINQEAHKIEQKNAIPESDEFNSNLNTDKSESDPITNDLGSLLLFSIMMNSIMNSYKKDDNK